MLVRLNQLDPETLAPDGIAFIDCHGASRDRIANAAAALMLRFEEEGDEWRVGLWLRPGWRCLVVAPRAMAEADELACVAGVRVQ